MKFTLSIKKNNVFKYILKKGKYAKGIYIAVHITDKKLRENKVSNVNYLGICVSKKNGNSVQRNKLKRWVREVYKLEEKDLKNNMNIVVLYKKNVNFNMVEFHKIQADIKKCFEELDLYEKK